jgi:hypothetical protein
MKKRERYATRNQARSSRRKTVHLVVSADQIISRESLKGMIGDGLARIIAAHLGKRLWRTGAGSQPIIINPQSRDKE